MMMHLENWKFKWNALLRVQKFLISKDTKCLDFSENQAKNIFQEADRIKGNPTEINILVIMNVPGVSALKMEL